MDLLIYLTETLASQLAVEGLVLLFAPYRSIKAIQSKDVNKTRSWLTFWIVYGFVNFLDNFDWILDFIPYYVIFKFFFVLFLMLGGSRIIFALVVEPFVRNVVDKKLT